MAAYVVIPVIVLTIVAIWLLVYLYDKRFKKQLSTMQHTTQATACRRQQQQQERIVYTISNTDADANGNGNNTTTIQIGPDGHIRPPQYGYTNQNLVVVSSAVPKDLPPSYEQVTGNRDPIAPNNGTQS